MTGCLGLFVFFSSAMDLLRKRVELSPCGAGWKYNAAAESPRWLLPPSEVAPPGAARKQDAQCYTVKGGNVYQDVHSHWSVVVVRFVSQVMLIGFVFYSCLTDPEVHLPRPNPNGDHPELNLSCLFFCCSFPMQLLASKQMGFKFTDHADFWHFLRTAAAPDGVGRHSALKTDLTRTSAFFRCVLGFITNSVSYDLVIFLLPIVLARQETFFDFVCNVFAVMFIATLDDHDGKPVVLKDAARVVMGIPDHKEEHHDHHHEHNAWYTGFSNSHERSPALTARTPTASPRVTRITGAKDKRTLVNR